MWLYLFVLSPKFQMTQASCVERALGACEQVII